MSEYQSFRDDMDRSHLRPRYVPDLTPRWDSSRPTCPTCGRKKPYDDGRPTCLPCRKGVPRRPAKE